MFACDSPVRTWRLWFSGAVAEPSSPLARESVRVFLRKKVPKKFFSPAAPFRRGGGPPRTPPCSGVNSQVSAREFFAKCFGGIACHRRCESLDLVILRCPSDVQSATSDVPDGVGGGFDGASWCVRGSCVLLGVDGSSRRV